MPEPTMSDNPTERLLRDALHASVDDVTVPSDLADRVTRGRRRDHRRGLAVKVAVPLTVLAAGVATLAVTDGSTGEAPVAGPSTSAPANGGSDQVTFRLVSNAAPAAAGTDLARCQKLAKKGFTTALPRNAKLSLDEATQGCLSVLARDRDGKLTEVTGGVGRTKGEFHFEIFATKSGKSALRLVATGVDPDEQLVVERLDDDLVVYRSSTR